MSCHFRLRKLSQCFLLNCNYRYYSARESFIQKFFDKLKEDSQRDKQLKDSISKFREETEKLEKSKELQYVRDLYKKIEKEIPADSFGKLRDNVENIRHKIKNETDELMKLESYKKSMEAMEKTFQHVKDATASLGDSEVIKKAQQGIHELEKELQSDRAMVYRAPKLLKTRTEVAGRDEITVEANTTASGIVLHKDSKWFAAWQEFKDKNEYVQKFFDLRNKYEESDNLAIRSVRFVTDKVSGIFGNMGSKSELQAVLDEITKMDPNFTLEGFLRFCRFDVLPNVLEAMTKGDMRILKDWCHDAPYNILKQHFKEKTDIGLSSDSQVLDLTSLDVQMGKIMDQGPVLIISFQSQEIHCWRDATGQVKEGDPERVLRVTHFWALCRDQEELNPWTAWRLLEIANSPTEQWL